MFIVLFFGGGLTLCARNYSIPIYYEIKATRKHCQRKLDPFYIVNIKILLGQTVFAAKT